MKLPSPEKLLEDQLKDLYSAESQLLKALPKMAKAASTPELKEAFRSHLEETRGQVDRLKQIGEHLAIKLTGKKCKAMEGLIEEGAEVLEAEGPGPILDAAFVAAAQRVEHYEISAYGTARSLATHLGLKPVAALLEATLREESAADEKLTQVCQSAIYPAMAGTATDANPKPGPPRKPAAKPARATGKS
jgi:ferritin-like metal-binding protein YciE